MAFSSRLKLRRGHCERAIAAVFSSSAVLTGWQGWCFPSVVEVGFRFIILMLYERNVLPGIETDKSYTLQKLLLWKQRLCWQWNFWRVLLVTWLRNFHRLSSGSIPLRGWAQRYWRMNITFSTLIVIALVWGAQQLFWYMKDTKKRFEQGEKKTWRYPNWHKVSIRSGQSHSRFL